MTALFTVHAINIDDFAAELVGSPGRLEAEILRALEAAAMWRRFAAADLERRPEWVRNARTALRYVRVLQREAVRRGRGLP